jgi:hypothetical protein
MKDILQFMEGHMATRGGRSNAQGFEKTSKVMSDDNLFDDSFSITSSDDKEDEKEDDPPDDEK